VKVSVAVIAYNHERYIAQALDSVLSQKTAFEFEVVIVEDCSRDGTRSIIQQYCARFPDKIRAIFHATNMGARKTVEEALLACRGQYVAMLDGDDYWTSADKLQRQADLLDKHPDMMLCCHPTRYLFENGETEVSHPADGLTFMRLLKANPVQSQTIMFRRCLFSGYPQWMHENASFPGDYFLVISAGQHGELGFIDEVMSVYRVHDAGAWGSLEFAQRLDIEIATNQALMKWLGRRYFPLLLLWNIDLRRQRLRERTVRRLLRMFPWLRSFRSVGGEEI